MSKPTSTQRAYWMKTLWGWAEDRLSDPQFVECDSVLNYHIDAAAELATVKAQRDELMRMLESLSAGSKLYSFNQLETTLAEMESDE